MGQGPIVYVSEYFWPFGAGGAEHSTAKHASLMARAGYPVIVVTPNYGAADREEKDGYSIHRFPFIKLQKQGEQAPETEFLNPGFHRKLADHIVEAVSGIRPRLIHAQNTHSLVGAALAAKRLGVPLLTHIRDTSSICTLGASCLVQEQVLSVPTRCGFIRNQACLQKYSSVLLKKQDPLHRFVLAPARQSLAYWNLGNRWNAHEQADRIVFVSQGIKNIFEGSAHFCKKEKHRVLYNWALPATEPTLSDLPDLVQSLVKHKSPYLLFVGKTSVGKGFAVLLEAFKSIAQKFPEIQLVVAGNADPEIVKHASEKVHFLGFVERIKVDALFAHCKAVVLPSIWPEPLGGSLLDAGRFGKPIIASHVGGCPEVVVEGQTGFLVPPKNPEALDRAVSKVIGMSADQYETMSRHAKKHMNDKFGETAITAQLLNLYQAWL